MLKKKWIYLSILVGFVLIIYVQINEDAPIIITILGVVFLFFGLANIMSSIKGDKPSKDWVVNEHDEEE